MKSCMKSWSSIPALIMVAVFGAGLMEEALASCGSDDRVKHNRSECLYAEWENNAFKRWPNTRYGSRFYATNQCSTWGTIVVKWDLINATDRTWHLSHGNRRSGHSGNKVRSSYCCSDLSDLCNRSDMATVSGCRSKFEESAAYDEGCRLDSGTDGASIEDDSDGAEQFPCTIAGTCPADDDTSTQTSIRVNFLGLEHLVNCDGTLTLGAC